MAINPMALMKIRSRMNIFRQDHPKIGPFFQMLKDGAVVEGAVYELKVTTPDGKDYTANIRLTANDVETIQLLSNRSFFG